MKKAVRAAVALSALLTAAVGAQAPTAVPQRGGAPPARMRIDRDIEYSRVGTRALRLDLYRREPGTAPSPVVVWIHPGGSSAGDKSPTPAAALATSGFAVASIEYRPSAEAPYPAQLHDGKAAIRWLRAHAQTYNLDGDHIGVWGHEAGGLLASLLGTTGDVKELEGSGGNLDQSSRVQAVVDFAGPVGDSTSATGPANPATYISADDPPFLIVHGTADRMVSPRHSELLVALLKRAGVDASLELQPGVSHDLGQLLTVPVLETVAGFFGQLRGQKRDVALSPFLPSPADAWTDPVALDLGGTRYKTYPTPSRGPNTIASYRLYLPPDYDTSSTRRYPVIYVTHGMNVDSTRPVTSGYVARIDRAIRGAVMPPAIVVVIQGLNKGWWVDSRDGQFPMESVVIKDLIPHVDASYRTIARLEARAIEGHSMGGYGALRLGFKYPELFTAVTATAPALIPIENFSTGNNQEMFRTTFGADAAYYDEAGPWSLAAKNAEQVRTQTIRLICGDKDGLFPRSQWMDGLLTKLGIPHEFTPVPGAPHNHDQLLQFETFDHMTFYGKVFATLATGTR